MVRESSYLVGMDHFMRARGKMTICGVMVDLLLKIHTTKDKLGTEWLMAQAPSKIALRFTQENGDAIRGMEEVKKYTKIKDIVIRAHLLMINIMVSERLKMKTQLTLANLVKDFFKAKELSAINQGRLLQGSSKMDRNFQEDIKCLMEVTMKDSMKTNYLMGRGSLDGAMV